MRVTILKDDSTVSIDGERHAVDCTDLPVDFHALQWYGALGGEVEYRMTTCAHCNARSKKPNQTVSDFTPYTVYVDRWKAAKAAAEAEKASTDVAGPQS